jgi:hypothetical protein
MIDFLVKKLGGLNYQLLLHLISENRIEFVNTRLLGALGMTTYTKIYVDLDQLSGIPANIVYFIFLHEIYHYKRYQELGKKFHVDLFSSTNFSKFHSFVVEEERAADNYGRLKFREFNGIDYPVEYTQMLDDPNKQKRYERNTRMLFGKVKNETDLDNLYNKFILN